MYDSRARRLPNTCLSTSNRRFASDALPTNVEAQRPLEFESVASNIAWVLVKSRVGTNYWLNLIVPHLVLCKLRPTHCQRMTYHLVRYLSHEASISFCELLSFSFRVKFGRRNSSFVLSLVCHIQSPIFLLMWRVVTMLWSGSCIKDAWIALREGGCGRPSGCPMRPREWGTERYAETPLEHRVGHASHFETQWCDWVSRAVPRLTHLDCSVFWYTAIHTFTHLCFYALVFRCWPWLLVIAHVSHTVHHLAVAFFFHCSFTSHDQATQYTRSEPTKTNSALSYHR